MTDATATTPAGNAPSQDDVQLDVAIVGGGLAGLYALHRMRSLGITARVFEAGNGVGGTWFWNRYPGARCDIESLEYSYGFSDELQQEWKWPERYATQPQILAYINHVAERFDLMRDVQLGTRILAAEFDRSTDRWTLRSDKDEVISAQFCIMATGNLSTPRVPDFKGLENFKGSWYHSGMWPAAGVDFSGQRVGVIGTGSSGIQMIPLIAKQAKHLFVFQRTPNFSLPAQNGPMEYEREQSYKANYPDRRQEARVSGFGVSGYPTPTKSALEVPAEERRRNYEELWKRGGSIGFLSCYNDFLVDERANDTAAEFVREKIRSIVRDPAIAEMLAPKDHPIGTKRLCLDTGYYETYNRDNVSLIDVHNAPIEEITERGVRTADGEYELDAIAFATGFDAMTGALREIDLRVKGGDALADVWEAGPRTYLGLCVAGFPNMFMVTGPGSPSVKSQMILSIEQHVDWISNFIDYARSGQISRIEADLDAQDCWVAHVNEVADSTLYPVANSWYVGANIPGKPRVFMPYVAGVGVYRKKCDEVASNGYEGFKLSGRQGLKRTG